MYMTSEKISKIPFLTENREFVYTQLENAEGINGKLSLIGLDSDILDNKDRRPNND